MKKYVFYIIILLGFAVQTVQSQDRHPNSKIYIAYNRDKTFYGKTEIDSAVIKALAYNLPNYIHTPDIPNFAIIGRDRKFYLSFGGYIKVNATMDIGNPLTNQYLFVPSAIPNTTLKGNRELLQFGAGHSRINMSFVGLPNSRYTIGAYVDFDFQDPNYYFHLCNAYVKYFGFTLGYTNTLFEDIMAIPPTIDSHGPNSNVSNTNAVVNYQYHWKTHWSVGIGVERPYIYYTAGDYTSACNQRMPDIPLYVQFAWDRKNSWIRISALLRELSYIDNIQNKEINNFGWGIRLSGSAMLADPLIIYYNAVYGDGISNYIKDMHKIDLDMTPAINDPGKLLNTKAYGAYIALQYLFVRKAFICATYSFVNNYNDKAVFDPLQYKNGQYVAANIMWNIGAHALIGAEYLWGMKTTHNNEQVTDNRVQFLFKFTM